MANNRVPQGSGRTPSVAPSGLAVYLREAGRVPLLRPEQEVEVVRELARARRALHRLVPKLLGRLSRDARANLPPRPPAREVWALADLDRFFTLLFVACRGRRDAATTRLVTRARKEKRRLDRRRDELTQANLRLVVHVARRFSRGGLPLPDLVQEGNLGLMRAVDKFDPRRQTRFSTYAFWWIKQAMERAVGNQSRTVRVPVHLQSRARQVRQAAETLHRRYERKPTEDEIAEELARPTKEIRNALSIVRDAAPLEDSERVLDHLRRSPDPKATCPWEQTWKQQRRRSVEAVLQRSLTGQEQQVLRLRYGLKRELRPTLESIGESMGLSRERVRQIEHGALEKIRSGPHAAHLATFLDEG